MANLSTAEGTLTMTGSPDSLKAFLRLMRKARTWHYMLDITDTDDLLSELEDISDDTVTIESYFFAFGNWNFLNRIKSLTYTLKEERKTIVKTDDAVYEKWVDTWTAEDEMDWNQLQEHPLSLNFNFSEEESGNSFIGQSEIVMTWKTGDLLDVSTKTLEDATYEYSAENLREIMNYADVYDLSQSSVDDLDEDLSEQDWQELLTKHTDGTLNISGIGDPDNPRHQAFITTLKDLIKEEFGDDSATTVWYSADEWFEDEDSLDLVVKTLKTIN